MAEGDGALYNSFKAGLMEGTFNLASAGHTLKMILVSGYTPDIDLHDEYADVSGDEYGTGDGYTAGGATLGSQTVTQDNTNDRGVFDAANVTWSSLGALTPATPSHCILYDDTVAGDPLICYWELGTTATNGGDYTLQFSATGIMTLT